MQLRTKELLLLVSLLGGLGLASLNNLGGGGLDDAHGDGLPHVTDGEPSEGRVVGEGLDAHGLAGSSLTMAASPDLMNLGASSVDLPVRLSTFSMISANLQAM